MLGLFFLVGCSNGHEMENVKTSTNETIEQFQILVGDQHFAGLLYDSPAVREFKMLLPLNITMSELNGNEKYDTLPKKLPTASQAVATIEAGELMLFGTDTLVLFYENFSTSYSYTPLGKLTDPSQLKTALGNEEITLTIQLIDETNP